MRLVAWIITVGLCAFAPDISAAPLVPPEKPKESQTPEAPPATDVYGVAGPPTAAGTTGLRVTPGIEIFAQYAARFTQIDTNRRLWYHTFEVPRVHAALTGDYGIATGRVVLEGVRSASEGALVGVAGDSLLLRLREAWAGIHYGSWLTASAGVIPTLTIPELEGTWRLRVVGPAPIEQTGMLSPADLGVKVRFDFPQNYGFISIGAFNGEGYTSRELNRGKNVEMAASLHPAPAGVARPLAFFGSYVIGSSGTGSARADRFTGSLLWQGTRLRAGFSVTYAKGLADFGDRRSLLVDGFARLEPIENLIFGLRGSYWNRDQDGSGDTVSTFTGSAGYRIAQPLEAHVAVTRQMSGLVAQAALPGSDFWEIRLASRVVF